MPIVMGRTMRRKMISAICGLLPRPDKSCGNVRFLTADDTAGRGFVLDLVDEVELEALVVVELCSSAQYAPRFTPNASVA
jgi:hypothetical protein